MPLDREEGEKVLKLVTSRYNQREWRRKIEKILSLPPSGLQDENQRKLFLYLKVGLQAYKSRRADPPTWIVGGFATQEVIERAKFKPSVVHPEFTSEHVACLGVDPGPDVNEVWWEDMLVNWFVNAEEEEAALLAMQEEEANADGANQSPAENVEPSKS
ncbi:MAG: hypothetical protein KC563_05830 [Nitrospira sp.]|nr:hypothetical protein [Nitrospira sp.]MCA9475310.1 hypothetical protein [Nitrospira sp.]MCA9478761.1 hypothetical protein [Nitrospira sp.]